MRAILLTGCFVVGCGRFHFDNVAASVDARSDSSTALDSNGAACNPAAPFGSPVPAPGINDPTFYDSTIRPSADELTAHFYRTITDDDIYVATRPDRTATFVVAPVASLNTLDNDAHPTLSPDGTILAFFSTRAPSNALGDLWYATVAGGVFTVVGRIAGLDTPMTDYHPFFQLGSDDFYFTSDRTGDFAIYHTVHLANGSFESPTYVTELDVVGFDDGAAVVSADGLVVFFRSNRPGGQGDYDIWTASRASAPAPFGAASPVMELNSTFVESPNWISPDGCRLYMTSTRTGGSDIFIATRGP